jgi:hypothetical protein
MPAEPIENISDFVLGIARLKSAETATGAPTARENPQICDGSQSSFALYSSLLCETNGCGVGKSSSAPLGRAAVLGS